jgi:hypothetical protein
MRRHPMPIHRAEKAGIALRERCVAIIGVFVRRAPELIAASIGGRETQHRRHVVFGAQIQEILPVARAQVAAANDLYRNSTLSHNLVGGLKMTLPQGRLPRLPPIIQQKMNADFGCVGAIIQGDGRQGGVRRWCGLWCTIGSVNRANDQRANAQQADGDPDENRPAPPPTGILQGERLTEIRFGCVLCHRAYPSGTSAMSRVEKCDNVI